MIETLVHWKKSPAALFVPYHPWTAPCGPTSGRPNALLRVCRTSAAFPLKKGWFLPAAQQGECKSDRFLEKTVEKVGA
jgi:hypothetical protein